MKGSTFRSKLITIWRIMRNGFQNLFRNAWLSVAAIAIMVVTLSIVAGSILANMVLNETIDSASRELTISIFIKDDADPEKERSLVRSVESSPNVILVNYISKQYALAEFQERYPNLQEGVSISDGNPFPASYEVTLSNIDEYREIVEIAEAPQFADTVLRTSDNEQSRSAFNGFIGAKRFITRSSIIAGSIFAAISALVIFNTIRMAIFTRSDEIEIMKLIGARPSYIRGPFIVEACLYGVIAGIITISIIYSALIGLNQRLGENIKMDDTLELFTSSWPMVFGLVLGAGIGIGFLSSSIALLKYLRIKKW